MTNFKSSISRKNCSKAAQWLAEHVTYQGNDCIEWPFSRNPRNGYGMFRYQGMSTNAHRVMCIEAHGQPSHSKLHAAHKCGNRACMNPNHLRWATIQQNADDKRLHGTTRHSQETRDKMSRAKKSSQPIVVDGVEFHSIGSAARHYGIDPYAARSQLNKLGWSVEKVFKKTEG